MCGVVYNGLMGGFGWMTFNVSFRHCYGHIGDTLYFGVFYVHATYMDSVKHRHAFDKTGTTGICPHRSNPYRISPGAI